MVERVHDERSIFLQALELTGTEDRSCFLDSACGGNDRMRQEVEALLHAHAHSCKLLDVPDHMRPTAYGLSILERSGAVVGPYLLLEEIGEGGMGVVWLAEQTSPVRRHVALKIIKPGMDSRRVIARFAAERQALAMMDHPNIARVFDAGNTANGRPYVAMELVRGVPITQYCDQHNLTLHRRLELFLPVLSAVQHAHQKGIIHRDLKPSNVLVSLCDDCPVPKVIDFGVSKATGQGLVEWTTFTQSGQLVGTLEYMSPEQASFNVGDIDTRSDIYSLGVLLYELLTGLTPIDGQRLAEAPFDEILHIIRLEEPPRPSKRLIELYRAGMAGSARGAAEPARAGESQAPEACLAAIAAHRQAQPASLGRIIKGDLDWIVMKALEKDPNRRYETASALGMDLQRFLADEPVTACPPTFRYRLRKFVRRNKRTVLAASIVFLALVGGIIGTTWGMLRANDQLFLALLHQARAGRLSRQMGQRLDSLEALARAARIRPDARLRDEAIAAMALPDVRLVPGRHLAPHGTVAIAYNAQHGLCARGDGGGVISIRSLSDDREVRRIAWDTVPGYLCFSPDARHLLGRGAGDTLRVWRVADGEQALKDRLDKCQAHAFSPDGGYLAVGRQESIHCFDLTSGKELKSWHLPSRAVSLAFHPKDSRLAVGYDRSRVVSVYDAAKGVLLTDLPVGEVSDHVTAWDPDGLRLAVAGSDPRIQIWNVATKRKLATLEGHVQNVTDLTFHPQGDLLASHGWDGQLLLWHPGSGRRLISLTFVNDDCPAQFSVDGRWLGFTWDGEKADLLEVTRSHEYRTLSSSDGSGEFSSMVGDISPDGRLLAVGMNQGARVWDLRSGRELAGLPAGTEFVFFGGTPVGERRPFAADRPPWALLTGGRDGLLRWPVTSDGSSGERLLLGPPRRLSPLRRATFGRGPDGRTLVSVTDIGVSNKLLDPETGSVRQELGIHPLGEVYSLSGDGRWAASCGWHSDRVRLWNVRTGQTVYEWVLGRQTLVFFSPDSRVVIIARGEAFSFWDVETLLPIRRLRRDFAQFPGWVAFSADGRLMALEMAPAVVHLIDVANGRAVAKFADPHGDRATWQGFTPDGTQLVVLAGHTHSIHIWDLRAIRARLKDMNLDWDWPEFPAAIADESAPKPITIEVLSGERDRAQRGTTSASPMSMTQFAWQTSKF
jgi:serine/threonine protein kinase/WD40 repeat protein